MTRFLSGSEAPVPYSERKAETGRADEPWPLERIVAAQRMACDGMDVTAIAAALGERVEVVRRKLEAS
jgi:hypothetical protein